MFISVTKPAAARKMGRHRTIRRAHHWLSRITAATAAGLDDDILPSSLISIRQKRGLLELILTRFMLR